MEWRQTVLGEGTKMDWSGLLKSLVLIGAGKRTKEAEGRDKTIKDEPE